MNGENSASFNSNLCISADLSNKRSCKDGYLTLFNNTSRRFSWTDWKPATASKRYGCGRHTHLPLLRQ